MAKPWEKYGGAPASEPAPVAGPVTLGTPRAKEPPPVRPVVAETDEVALARARAALAQAPVDARKASADAEKAELELQAARKKAADPTGALGVEQSTAAGFYRRALNAHQRYGGGVPPRNAFVQGIANILPEGFVRSQSSPERRAAETYAAEFIAATLRKESGAAISPTEFESQYKRYFPQPGDGPAEFAIKKQLRETALEAIRVAAGPAAAQGPGPSPQAAAPLDPTGEGDIGFNQPGDALPEGAQEFRRELLQAMADGKVRTSEDFVAFGKARGFNLDPADAQRAAEAMANGVMPVVATPKFEDVGISGQRGEGGAGETVDAFVRGVADLPTLGFADEIAAAGETIFNGGEYRRNLARERGIDDYDSENNFGARTAGQFVGGIATAGLPGLSTKAPQIALQTTRSGLRGGLGRAEALVAGGRAGAVQAGKEGAKFGAAYGFGSGEGSILDRAESGAVNALLGGAAGYGLGRTVGAIGARSSAPGAAERNALGGVDEATEAARAAQRQGIDLLPADVGGPTARRLTSVVTQTPFGGAPIIKASENALAQGAAARDRLAANVGQAMEPIAAAERAQRGARRWNKAARAEVRGLYGQAEKLAGDTMATPQSTMQTIAGLVRVERETPGGTPALAILEEYAEAFAKGGPMTIAGARKLRSTLRSRLRTEGQLASSDADRVTQTIMRAVGDDIERSLAQAGKGAAIPAYRAADKAHATRLTTGEEAIAPYIGKDGDNWGSDVAKAIANDTRGNGERLSQFLRTLHPEEANDVRATLISSLGRARAGAQDANGGTFSFDEFLTNWNQIRDARGRLFDRETRKGLEDLAKVADRIKKTGKYYNRSQTGGIVAGGITFAPMAGVLGQAAMGGNFAPTLYAAMATSLGQYGAGRILAHPGFARRLAQTPMNPRAAKRYWSSPWVSAMASRDPSIAADLTGVRDAIIEAASLASDYGNDKP